MKNNVKIISKEPTKLQRQKDILNGLINLNDKKIVKGFFFKIANYCKMYHHIYE